MKKSASPRQTQTPGPALRRSLKTPVNSDASTNVKGISLVPEVPIQTKLTMGTPGDRYEQEADQVAAQVVNDIYQTSPPTDAPHTSDKGLAIAPDTIQRLAPEEEDELQLKTVQIQGKNAEGTPEPSDEFQQTLNRAKGGGSSLDSSFRAEVEPRMGADFSGVKVHTDGTAHELSESIQAKAFTTGNNIFFKQGEYNPRSRSGKELIAHELTHTLQQGQGQTIQRKTNDLTKLEKKVIGSQLIGTSTTENIQKCIVEYNAIANSDKNYDNQLKILEQLIGYTQKWLSKHGTEKQDKVPHILGVDQQAKAEKTKVLRSREQAKDTALETKNQSTTGTSKFEELTETEIDNIYNPIFEQIKAAVVSKLGVGRGAWRRSKELNAFRQELKDAARAQANQDIEEELQSQGSTGAMAKYEKMRAEVEAYSTAKGSVDETMRKEATKIATQVAVRSQYKTDMNQVAIAAANEAALKFVSKDPDLQQENSLKAIQSAKIIAAQTKAKQLAKPHLETAIDKARSITKGSEKATALQDNDQSLKGRVKEQVKTDEVGKKAIKAVVDADTLTKGFDKVSTLIDANAPSPGTGATLSIELRIKDPQTGGYFISQLSGEASKEQEEGEPLEVSLGAEFSLGGGWERFGLDLNAQAGFFFNSTSNETKKAVGLISYGLYRTLQTKDLDSTVANAIWGYGGKSALKDKGQEAETWATAMEEYLFTDGNGNATDSSSVEIGGLVKAGVKANLGVMTGELEGKGSVGKKYSAESIGPNVGKEKTSTDRAKLSQRIAYLEFAGALEAMQEFAGGEAGVKFAWEEDLSTNTLKFKSVEIEAAGFLNSALAKGGGDYGEVMNHVCKAIAGYVTSLAAIGKKAYNSAKSQRTTSQQVGDVGGAFTDLGSMAVTIGDQVGKEWGSKIVGFAGDEVAQDMIKSTALESSMNPMLDIKQQLKVGGSFSYEVGGDKKINVYVSQVKGIAMDTGSLLGEVFRLKIEGETTNKLISKTIKL